MKDLPIEIMDVILEELDAEGARQTLMQLVARPRNIVAAYFIASTRICIELSTIPSHTLGAAMTHLLNSVSLRYLELREQAHQLCASELTSLALQIVASAKHAKRLLTIVLVGLSNPTWRYCQFAGHLELRSCSIALDYPPPGNAFDLPLQSLSFSTDGGIETLETFNTLKTKLPYLTHLLLWFKPHGEDFEIDDAFVATLSTAVNLEDITIVYESNALDTTTLAAAVDNLACALTAVACLRKYAIDLHWRFTCSPYHVSKVLACMPGLEYFNLVSISTLGSEKDSRDILRQGYNFLVMPRQTSEQARPNRNKRFRVDRICVSISQQRTSIHGMTVRDATTRDIISRKRTHDTLFPWFRRHDTGNYEVIWTDSLVPAEEVRGYHYTC